MQRPVVEISSGNVVTVSRGSATYRTRFDSNEDAVAHVMEVEAEWEATAGRMRASYLRRLETNPMSIVHPHPADLESWDLSLDDLPEVVVAEYERLFPEYFNTPEPAAVDPGTVLRPADAGHGLLPDGRAPTTIEIAGPDGQKATWVEGGDEPYDEFMARAVGAPEPAADRVMALMAAVAEATDEPGPSFTPNFEYRSDTNRLIVTLEGLGEAKATIWRSVDGAEGVSEFTSDKHRRSYKATPGQQVDLRIGDGKGELIYSQVIPGEEGPEEAAPVAPEPDQPTQPPATATID